jgi:hypothetical protein
MRTTAEITAYEEQARGGHRYRYEFSIGGEAHAGVTEPGPERAIGDSVVAYYEPARPDVNSDKSFAVHGRERLMFAVPFLGVLIVAACAIILTVSLPRTRTPPGG